MMNEGEKMLEKNLSIAKETTLDVQGRIVHFIEYELEPEGEFVKVCTDDHELGVAAEYAWFRAQYPNAVRTRQQFTKIRLNGKAVHGDILTIRTESNETRTIYFDISQMMEDLHNRAGG